MTMAFALVLLNELDFFNPQVISSPLYHPLKLTTNFIVPLEDATIYRRLLESLLCNPYPIKVTFNWHMQ